MDLSNALSIGSLLIALVAYNDSRKASKLQMKVNQIEEQLKSYELIEKEKELKSLTTACIEASVEYIGNNDYVLKIYNSGKATAYNIDFIVPEEIRVIISKIPFEFLESGKSFDEILIVGLGTPRKFEVTTKWKDEQKNDYSKKQIVSY